MTTTTPNAIDRAMNDREDARQEILRRAVGLVKGRATYDQLVTAVQGLEVAEMYYDEVAGDEVPF
jgi:hypothetical protein